MCRAQDEREKQSDWDGSWSIRGSLGALTLCGRVQGQTLAVGGGAEPGRVSCVSLLVGGNRRIQDIPTPAILCLGRRSGVAMLENAHFWVKSRRCCRSFFALRHLEEYCKTFTPVYKVFAED